MNLGAKFWFLLLLSWLGMCCGQAATAVIYQTGFEDFSTNVDLVGQNGWKGAGSGGNGVLNGFFPGEGQQAYIGYAAPAATFSNLFVYHPVSRDLPQAQFSVQMAIVDSTNTNYDDFYWSVYNQRGDLLFTLDFDNFELKLYYYLDDGMDRSWSGLVFTNDTDYQLNIAMDFSNNLWNATFNGRTAVTNLPITTTGAPLNFGDVDAGWVIFDTNAPGNNFMVFDDYQVSGSITEPQLQFLGLLSGSPTMRISGLPDASFAVDGSTDLLNWSALKTNIATGGKFDYVDDTGSSLGRRFYRARWVP